jgi:Na+(H+)/acetate symporter ActP
MSLTKIVIAVLIAFGVIVASQFVVPLPFSSAISAVIIVLVLNRYWHDIRRQSEIIP